MRGPTHPVNAFLLAGLLLFASTALAERRFALIIGENQGNAGDATLRFAEDDAQRMRDVLVEVGQVAPADATLLLGATASTLRHALEGLGATLRDAAQPGNRLTLYVSSHAGDGALHLAGSELPLGELVDFVKQAPVDVGVLVIDACRAGSMTRVKGLVATSTPPVLIEATGLQGRVLISASGADEYAQESDTLSGSAFTHYLVLALRGAADASRDGRVTLDEAYAWAWSRTLESTFGSAAGAQHPNVKVDLHGQGQLVLTEPGMGRSKITLGVDAPGHWLIVNAVTRAVMADVNKPVGPMTLTLPPGAYSVRLRTDSGVLMRPVQLPAEGTVVVRDAELERASGLRSVAIKGGSPAVLALSAAAAVSTGLVGALEAQPGAELRLRRDGQVINAINQLNVSLGWRNGVGTLSGFNQNEVQLAIGGGHRFSFSMLSLFVGLEGGLLVVYQSNLPALPSRASLGPALAADLELRVPIAGPLELTLMGSAGGSIFRKESGLRVLPRATGSLGAAVVW